MMLNVNFSIYTCKATKRCVFSIGNGTAVCFSVFTEGFFYEKMFLLGASLGQ